VSDLETLHAEGNLPEASLPKLKKLFYYGTEMEKANNLMSTLSTYQNLTHLGLKDIEWQDMMRILERVGRQLSHLFYDVDVEEESVVDQYQLFHLCPNLVSYKQAIGENASYESPFKSHVSKHNFRNLQECTISEVPPDLFQMIFKSPSIKSIRGHNFAISKELCQVVESSESFHNVEEFCLMYLKGLEKGCTIKDVEEMVKTVVCSAPKLDYIDVSWIDESNCGESWKKSGALKFIELVNML